MTNSFLKCLSSSILVCIAFLFTGCKDKPLFSNVSSSHTNITFTNILEKKKLFNILYYLYYYNGGGVAIGDINNDGLSDIYFTANSRGNNKLYLNKGDLVFEDITVSSGVAGSSDWCSGVTMSDVNADGLLDIYVSAVSNSYGLKGHNELFINNGNGKFTESAVKYGLAISGLSTQAAFFDYDHDGDLDCYVLRHSKKPHANIVDTINRKKIDSISGDRLFRNDLNTSIAQFTDVSTNAGIYQSNLGYGLGLAIADLNNDGWDDIYIGNDFHENDYYYVNNGNGTFTESGAKHFRHYSRFSMGNDVADFNNDGHEDVITVDMLPPDERTLKTYGSDENPDVYKVKLEIQGYQHQYSRNCLQRNNGNGVSFSDVALMNGVAATDWSWAPLFADFDNDGYKDLFISSGIVKRPVDLDYVRFVSDIDRQQGIDRTDKYDSIIINNMPDGSSHPFLFKNEGKTFADVSKQWGTANMKGYFNGAAYSDLDNDGDLDLVINSLNAVSSVLKNNSTDHKYLSIKFKGDSLNTFGIGTKAYIFDKGKLQYQHVTSTRGFQSSVDNRLHFGLDTTSVIDSIMIVWPSQKYQVIKNVSSNTIFLASYANATGNFREHSFFSRKDTSTQFQSSLFSGIRSLNEWKHRENEFFDYNVQYLIPHAQSTRGPKIAVGDVNLDGLDDFYACGAKFQPGALMVQQSNGTFQSTDTSVFAKDAICEDTDAAFFDANGDGHLDLYVVSGGNEVPQNARTFEDRLYINDGTGHFSLSINAFTHQYENKSCVATADIDKDGDNDIFVGNLSSPTAYGITKTSYLYINDGKAKFSLAGTGIITLTSIGMVTSASFADLNNDSWPDLIVTGEWMPLMIFMNNKGVFTSSSIDASTGLWQTVFPTDVNGDGHTDILAGNWGHNSKLYAGKDGPLKLYVKDFDNNGSTEQILAYNIDGKEYTFLAKDELERSLPVLKKAYLKYSEVAGKTVQYMFYDLFKDYKELKAETLSSSCFINDGKGNFSVIVLPDELQLAPVMSFAQVPGKRTWFAAGNFYGVIPYEGRYDALLPTLFVYDSQFQVKGNFPTIDGEMRDAKWIKVAGDKKGLLLARNNRELLFLDMIIDR